MQDLDFLLILKYLMSTGTNVKEDEKSIAYKLTFSDNTRTLEEDEVMEVFKRIIDEVTTKCNAVLRDK